MRKKNILTKSQILKCLDLPRELVEVPEWGGSVYIRAMNGSERDTLEKRIYSKDGVIDSTDLRPILLSMTLVDESGDNLFTRKDIEALSKKNAKVLDSLALKAQVLSGMREESIEEEQGN